MTQELFSETNYVDSAVKDICYNCGSSTAIKSYNFFRRMNYVSGGKKNVIWCKIWYQDDVPVAFFYANRCRYHVRLIEIAVKEVYHRLGLGRKILNRLLIMMKEERIDTLTFRTPNDEKAQFFWAKMGAKITDVKGKDYEMELKIKIKIE